MTIIRDLSLSPEGRLQRRLDQLEGGYISNQQTGTWIKSLGVTAQTNNETEVGVTVNGLAFTIPAYGQYEVILVMDGAAGSGYAQGYIQLGFVGNTYATYISPQAVRGTLTSHWGGFLEPGVVVSGKLARIAGAGVVSVFGGNLTIKKLA